MAVYNFSDICLLQHGESALHMAASGGHVEVIQYLQTKDADVQLQDKVTITQIKNSLSQQLPNIQQFLILTSCDFQRVCVIVTVF